ncbi:hypothetical protein A2587_01045 [Candidatus Nomurabacteria bacterium RIFOXYD1_FULL_42_14]|nr:MAG: hypothetical protein A2587_01045 [Candidatus Nomurabacteria bacterium RIFOXYD1_FULL_42_14]
MLNNKKDNYLGRFLLAAILLMTSFLVVLSFPSIAGAVSGEPDVSTRNATYLTNRSAILNGVVDGKGYSTTAWFEYGTNNNLGNSTRRRSYGNGQYEIDYSDEISGLHLNTTYYFRAVVSNSRGTDYGSVYTFRTGSGYYNQNTNYYDNQFIKYRTPTATTELAISVSSNSARLNATVSNPTNDPTNAWFEWGTTPDLGNKTAIISLGSLPAVRHINVLTGLSPGTTYYFRAVAENPFWRNIGSVLSFTTNSQYITTTTVSRNQPIVPTIDNSRPYSGDEINYTVEHQNDNEFADDNTFLSLGANVFGAGFFPDNVFGWLLLILLILVLIMLVKYLFTQPFSKSKKTTVVTDQPLSKKTTTTTIQ